MVRETVRATTSRQPRKQRKARIHAPNSRRRKMMASPLSRELRERNDFYPRRLTVRKGDVVLVTRGGFSGHEGKVLGVNLKKMKVTIDGVVYQKADNTSIPKPIDPSNIEIIKLDLSDKRRKKKFERILNSRDLSEEEIREAEDELEATESIEIASLEEAEEGEKEPEEEVEEESLEVKDEDEDLEKEVKEKDQDEEVEEESLEVKDENEDLEKEVKEKDQDEEAEEKDLEKEVEEKDHKEVEESTGDEPPSSEKESESVEEGTGPVGDDLESTDDELGSTSDGNISVDPAEGSTGDEQESGKEESSKVDDGSNEEAEDQDNKEGSN